MNIPVRLLYLRGITILIIGLIHMSSFIKAQEVLFPGLTGEELADAIRAEYTPDLQLTYGEARDTLYAYIDRIDDTVSCLYTDVPVRLELNGDPTSTLFDQGINTEHIYPQGRGATEGTPPYFNMYNLWPSRVEVNQDRADLPLLDIPDGDTEKWYYLDQQLTHIPSEHIDDYTEGHSTAFEPRESVKGDIARSMFYIHTIYEDQVEAVDPTFFAVQQDDLCFWHSQDPVDDLEAWRNDQIALWQDDKSNPFVLDCTLAERLFCENNCIVTTSSQRESDSFVSISTQGNQITLTNESGMHQELICKLYTMNGMQVEGSNHTLEHQQSVQLLSNQRSEGMYFIYVRSVSGATMGGTIWLY